MKARRPLVGGNWKMYKTAAEAATTAAAIAAGRQGKAITEGVLFPSHPLLPAVAAALAAQEVGDTSPARAAAQEVPDTSLAAGDTSPAREMPDTSLAGAPAQEVPDTSLADTSLAGAQEVPDTSLAAREVGATTLALGGQDLHADDEGAHTGDVSGLQLVDAGCRWVLCGHSERRRDHGESDAVVAAKLAAAARHGLLPLLCLGESLEERQAGATATVLARQLLAALAVEDEAGAGLSFDLAYEPVWAIGTGRTASPEQAQEAHATLRALLARERGAEAAATTRIVYGGSVKPDNAAALAAGPDIDGFLVGGASLEAASFLAIMQACDAAAG